MSAEYNVINVCTDLMSVMDKAKAHKINIGELLGAIESVKLGVFTESFLVDREKTNETN